MIASRTFIRPLVAAALVAAGCNVYADPVDDGSASGNVPGPSASALVSNDDAGTAPTPVFCPPERPVDDTQCSIQGSVCEYGETPDVTCNPRVECQSSPIGATGALPPAWSTDAPIGGCVAHTCPDTFAAITNGSPCDAPTDAGDGAEYLCGYPEGVCGCSTGPDGAHAHARRWDCAPPPTSPCPSARPHIGQPCDFSGAGVTCDYGSCIWKHGTAMRCDGQSWQATEVPCK